MDKNKHPFIFILLNLLNEVINIYHDTIQYRFHIKPFQHLILIIIIHHKNNKFMVYDGVPYKKNQLII